jgi:hypothetical protein
VRFRAPSTATPTPDPQTNLRVIKQYQIQHAMLGLNVTFTRLQQLIFSPSRHGVSVSDVLSSGYTFVSATPSSGTWTAPNWSMKRLANGANTH